MKLSGLIAIILLVSVVLISWGSLVNDFENNYINTSISDASPMNSSFVNTYSDRAEEINRTFSPSMEDINDLSSQDGWFDAIGDGSNVIALLVINFPKAVMTTLFSVTGDVGEMLDTIGIPKELVLIAIVLLSVWGLFKVIGFLATRGSDSS